MNFKKDENEKPTLAAGSFAKKTSGFSVNNLGKTSASFMEKIKNLSRKDMAIVGMGLSILVMAPIAEFMMTKPSSDNLLTPGFGERKGSDSGMPNLYDSGVNALSAGSPDGSGEVIVPLTARDPSSLIVGSQSAPPPVTVAPPSTFRDSMRDVAPKAFSEAVKSSPAPFTPSSRLASSLRGMGSFFSGGESSRTSGNLGGGKILADAQGVSKKSEKRSMAGPVAIPGYKGVASNTPNSASKGALEKLRGQADKAAGFFSGDNAVKALQDAAAASVKGEGSGALGGVSDSEKIKPASGSNTRNSGSYSPGDPCRGSLATQLACEDAKSWAQFKRQLKQDLFKGLVESVTKPISQKISDSISGLLNPYTPPKPIGYCKFPNGSSVALYGGKNKDNNPTTSPMSIADCIASGGQFVTNSGGSPSGGANPSGDSSASISSQVLENLQKSIDEYDSKLKKAVEAFADSDGKDKDDMKSGAGFLTQALGTGKDIARTINSLTSSNVGTVVASYNDEIGKVETKVRTEAAATQEFNRKLQAAIDKARGERISTVRTSQGTAEVDSRNLNPQLESMIAQSRVIESSFTAMNDTLQYHRNAVSFYNSQKSKIFSAAQQLGTGYETKASEISSYSSQIEEGKELAKIYEKIVGISTAGAVSNQESPVKFAFISRGVLPEEYKPDNMVREHFEGEKVKDKKARDAESLVTADMPYAQLFTGRKAPREAEVKNSIVSASVRALISLPKDIEGMKDKIKEMDSQVAVLKSQIDGFKSQLKSMGIEGFDDAAVSPSGNNGGTNNGGTNNGGANNGGTNNGGNNGGANNGGTNNGGTNNGGAAVSSYNLSSDMTVVNNALSRAGERYQTAVAANNCTTNTCKRQLANANTALEEMRASQRKLTELEQRMTRAANDEERRTIKTQFDEEKRKFDEAQKKFDGKGLRTASDGSDSICGQDINMSCVEKRIGVSSRPHNAANNSGNNSGNNSVNNAGNNSGNNAANDPNNSAGNNANKKCYETADGCKTIGNFAIVRKWKIKTVSSVIYTYESLWNQYVSQRGLTNGSVVDSKSVCRNFWSTITFSNSGYAGWRLRDKPDSERCAKFLDEFYVLAEDSSGRFPTSENIQPLVFDKQNNGRYATKDQSIFVFDRFNMECSQSGGKWNVSSIRAMVKQSFTEGESNSLGLSLGFSKGVTGSLSYSHTWTKSQTSNFTEPIIIYRGSPSAFCGSSMDRADK